MVGKFITTETLDELCVLHPIKSKETNYAIDIKKINIHTLSEMERFLQVNIYCPYYLQKWLTPQKWLRSAGNRDQIFKDLLTLFDLTNTPDSVVLQFFAKHFVPVFPLVNYDRNINYLETILHDARSWKNV